MNPDVRVLCSVRENLDVVRCDVDPFLERRHIGLGPVAAILLLEIGLGRRLRGRGLH